MLATPNEEATLRKTNKYNRTTISYLMDRETERQSEREREGNIKEDTSLERLHLQYKLRRCCIGIDMPEFSLGRLALHGPPISTNSSRAASSGTALGTPRA